jgi:hypothetical protein
MTAFFVGLKAWWNTVAKATVGPKARAKAKPKAKQKSR